MAKQRAYWTCQIVGWTVLYGISMAISAVSDGFSFNLVLNHALAVCIGIGVSHSFRTYAGHASWTDLPLRQLAPRVLGATLILGAAYTGLGDLLILLDVIEPVGMDEDAFWTPQRLLISAFGSAMVMFMWLVTYFGVHFVWNYRQAEVDKWKLEAQAETARLKALKLQLNPHFFFNSLNSVRALIAEDPDRAQRMVTRLARLLRTTLQVDDVKTVPLEEELSTVRTYLELERVRFEDRLDYEIDAAEEALGHPVPFLLVQTLVENGIKHGIAQERRGGMIEIQADVDEEALRLQVTNPGHLESEDGGIGLSNARERLRLLFGDEASLAVENATSDRVVATTVLPLRPEEQREQGHRSALSAAPRRS